MQGAQGFNYISHLFTYDTLRIIPALLPSQLHTGHRSQSGSIDPWLEAEEKKKEKKRKRRRVNGLNPRIIIIILLPVIIITKT